jgi:hypothetical protein
MKNKQAINIILGTFLFYFIASQRIQAGTSELRIKTLGDIKSEANADQLIKNS